MFEHNINVSERQAWNKKDDLHFMELVEEHGVKNWSKIAQKLGKSAKKCS